MFVNIDNAKLYEVMTNKITKIFNTAKIYKSTDKRNSYIDVPVSIDIETTQTEEFAFPYVYMIGIDSICYATRYKDTFIDVIQFLADLCEELDCTLIIFIHNLNYELTFFNGYFNKQFKMNVFATEKNKALSVRLNKLLILDTLRLTNMSLSKVATNYNLKHKKAIGQLDYNKYRDCTTPLSGVEKEYCSSDVIILNEYWEVYKKFALTKKQLFRLIQTSTGITRQVIQSNVKNRKETQRLIWQYNDYSSDDIVKGLIDRSYIGAFVKSNRNLTQKVLKNVGMWDYTSSYIGVLYEYKFPCGKFKLTPGVKTKDIIENHENTAYIFDIEFTDVKSKFGFSTISKHKVIESENVILDNGRIMSCDKLIVTFTDMDLLSFFKFYDYDKCRILTCATCGKQYLPRYVLQSAYNLFVNKQQLKHDKNRDEQMYLLIKGQLNAIYGVCCEKEKTVNYKYDIDTGLYSTERNNKKSKGFMIRVWGNYICAYARYNLLDTIATIEEYKKDSVIYTDTDSIKVNNPDEQIYNIVNEKNKLYDSLIKKCCCYTNFDRKKLEDIGMWDYEGIVESFITNGSKKYAVCKNGKWNVTISGINRQNYLKYCTMNSLDVVDSFKTDKLIIPSKYTNKLACNYVALNDWIIKPNINPVKGFVYLKPVDFTFKLDDKYSLLLENINNADNVIMECDII